MTPTTPNTNTDIPAGITSSPVERFFLASYLADIGDEISPERFQSYLDDIERIAPPEVYATLLRAAAALDEAPATAAATLALHDALPICLALGCGCRPLLGHGPRTC